MHQTWAFDTDILISLLNIDENPFLMKSLIDFFLYLMHILTIKNHIKVKNMS